MTEEWCGIFYLGLGFMEVNRDRGGEGTSSMALTKVCSVCAPALKDGNEGEHGSALRHESVWVWRSLVERPMVHSVLVMAWTMRFVHGKELFTVPII